MRSRFLLCAAALSIGAAAPAFAQPDAIVFDDDVSFEGNASFGSGGGLKPSESAIMAGNLTILLNNLGGVEPGTNAYRGFTRAAEIWSKAFTDPITVRLDVAFAPLGPGILGSTGSTTNSVTYASLRGALAADAKSFRDNAAVKSLQPGPTVSFVSNELGLCVSPFTGCQAINATRRGIDNDNTFDNLAIQINTAQVKALGGTPAYNPTTNPLGRDGSVQFSSNFAFDFDPSDGITPGQFDFIGVAVHEIGHALGFRSGVDIADINAQGAPGVPPGGRAGLDGIAWGTVHDLYRYKDFNGTQTLDWTIGGDPCFSLDAGATCIARLSTGRNLGDGRQASHWKDDLLTGTTIGIMDPTATGPSGVLPMMVTQFDLIAFDAMGWDLFVAVPQPASLALFGLGAAGLMLSRRRRG